MACLSRKLPIPKEVVTVDGKIVIADGEISEGQNVWQAMGGMQLGSVWGHTVLLQIGQRLGFIGRVFLFLLCGHFASMGKKYNDL